MTTDEVLALRGKWETRLARISARGKATESELTMMTIYMAAVSLVLAEGITPENAQEFMDGKLRELERTSNPWATIAGMRYR